MFEVTRRGGGSSARNGSNWSGGRSFAPIITRIEGRPVIHRRCAASQMEEERGRPSRANPAHAPTGRHDGGTGLGSGRALEPETRRNFEARLGRDFSQVRVHTDRAASES